MAKLKTSMTMTDLDADNRLTDAERQRIHAAINDFMSEVENDPFQNALRAFLTDLIYEGFAGNDLALNGEIATFSDGWGWAMEYFRQIIESSWPSAHARMLRGEEGAHGGENHTPRAAEVERKLRGG